MTNDIDLSGEHTGHTVARAPKPITPIKPAGADGLPEGRVEWADYCADCEVYLDE